MSAACGKLTRFACLWGHRLRCGPPAVAFRALPSGCNEAEGARSLTSIREEFRRAGRTVYVCKHATPSGPYGNPSPGRHRSYRSIESIRFGWGGGPGSWVAQRSIDAGGIRTAPTTDDDSRSSIKTLIRIPSYHEQHAHAPAKDGARADGRAEAADGGGGGQQRQRQCADVAAGGGAGGGDRAPLGAALHRRPLQPCGPRHPQARRGRAARHRLQGPHRHH